MGACYPESGTRMVSEVKPPTARANVARFTSSAMIVVSALVPERNFGKGSLKQSIAIVIAGMIAQIHSKRLSH